MHGCSWGGISTVGLDAGRGTTRVTTVASALQPVKNRASGATASITEHCDKLTQIRLIQLKSTSVMQRPSPRQPRKSRRPGTEYEILDGLRPTRQTKNGGQSVCSKRLVTEPSSNTARIA